MEAMRLWPPGTTEGPEDLHSQPRVPGSPALKLRREPLQDPLPDLLVPQQVTWGLLVLMRTFRTVVLFSSWPGLVEGGVQGMGKCQDPILEESGGVGASSLELSLHRSGEECS